MENSSFIDDTEWDKLISENYAWLINELMIAQPDFYRKEQELSGDGSTKDFAVAGDFLSSLGVVYADGSGNRRPLELLVGDEIWRFNHTTAGTSAGYHFIRNTGASTHIPMVRLLPTPANGQTYYHIYTVAPDDPSSDSDVLTGIAGFESVVILKTAITALEKENSLDTANSLRNDLAEWVAQIDTMKEARMMREAGHVVDRHASWEPDDRWDPASYWRTST